MKTLLGLPWLFPILLLSSCGSGSKVPEPVAQEKWEELSLDLAATPKPEAAKLWRVSFKEKKQAPLNEKELAQLVRTAPWNRAIMVPYLLHQKTPILYGQWNQQLLLLTLDWNLAAEVCAPKSSQMNSRENNVLRISRLETSQVQLSHECPNNNGKVKAVVGRKLLERFEWVIDLERHFFYVIGGDMVATSVPPPIVARESTPQKSIPGAFQGGGRPDRSGLDFSDDGSFEIMAVDPKSKAHQMGVRPGNYLTAVDGMGAKKLGVDFIRKRFSDRKSTHVIIKIMRGPGEEKELILPLSNLR